MDEDIFYASDDRSSIEVIERDFCVSDRRSRGRRGYADQFVTIDDIVQALCIVFAAIGLAIMASVFFPS